MLLQDIIIWLEMGLPLCNHLVVVRIDSKTPRSFDEEIRCVDNLAEPLDALVVSRFDAPGVEDSVDEETSRGALDVFVGKMGDWRFGFRHRFILAPQLFHLGLCRAHVLFSGGEDLLNELRRQVEQAGHGVLKFMVVCWADV
jgi:hypothetical protein